MYYYDILSLHNKSNWYRRCYIIQFDKVARKGETKAASSKRKFNVSITIKNSEEGRQDDALYQFAPQSDKYVLVGASESTKVSCFQCVLLIYYFN